MPRILRDISCHARVRSLTYIFPVETESAWIQHNDYAIPPYYDSMIAKIIVYDKDRRSAIRKMISALGEVAIEGVKTNVDFLYELLNQPDFQEGNITTDFIPQHYPDL